MPFYFLVIVLIHMYFIWYGKKEFKQNVLFSSPSLVHESGSIVNKGRQCRSMKCTFQTSPSWLQINCSPNLLQCFQSLFSPSGSWNQTKYLASTHNLIFFFSLGIANISIDLAKMVNTKYCNSSQQRLQCKIIK